MITDRQSTVLRSLGFLWWIRRSKRWSLELGGEILQSPVHVRALPGGRWDVVGSVMPWEEQWYDTSICRGLQGGNEAPVQWLLLISSSALDKGTNSSGLLGPSLFTSTCCLILCRHSCAIPLLPYFLEVCRSPSVFTTLFSSRHFHHFTHVSQTLTSCSLKHKARVWSQTLFGWRLAPQHDPLRDISSSSWPVHNFQGALCGSFFSPALSYHQRELHQGGNQSWSRHPNPPGSL